MKIEEIEQRFKDIADLPDIDLSKSVIKQEDYPVQQVKTRKEKSKEYGEVFTPLFLVDKMLLLKFDELNIDTKTCDLCSGYGQFTIRLMRMLYNKFKMNVADWLKNSHTLTELQDESCAKLVYIFGPDINLYAGDSLKMNYAEDTDQGILFLDEKEKHWKNNQLLTDLIHKEIVKNNLKLLIYIFENHLNNNRLRILTDRLKNYK